MSSIAVGTLPLPWHKQNMQQIKWDYCQVGFCYYESPIQIAAPRGSAHTAAGDRGSVCGVVTHPVCLFCILLICISTQKHEAMRRAYVRVWRGATNWRKTDVRLLQHALLQIKVTEMAVHGRGLTSASALNFLDCNEYAIIRFEGIKRINWIKLGQNTRK